ncbi:MAG: hypothetical protein CL691_06175 [Cellvibrionales bacterium]|nr:hypothetical protein [Cellvibrionales bacterium]
MTYLYNLVRYVFLVIVSLIHVQASANEIALSIYEELIDFRMTSHLQQNFAGELAVMHTNFEDNGADQISYRFYNQDELGSVNFELGARLYWLDAETPQGQDIDGHGLTLDIGSNHQLSDALLLELNISYAPDIITGGDFENVTEWDVRLSYQLVEKGNLFVGLRNLEVDTGQQDFDVYDDAYFGLKFEF